MNVSSEIAAKLCRLVQLNREAQSLTDDIEGWLRMNGIDPTMRGMGCETAPALA